MTDTILIVDDSSFIVEGLVAILKKNYHPLAAYSGPQCLELLQTQKPAIIILDIMMEPMDGWETLARIKEDPATRHIPILMFSAKKISAEEAEEHRISIDDFVSKPVNTKKLIESIEKVLARQKTNRLNIESWKSAGISQDRIDEFTSLMTNLEVDMSLLQNMKVQLSLVHEDDYKSRSDFEAVIAAIENRIQEERLHEEELSSDMQKSIVKDAEVKERAEPVPAINDGVPGSLPADWRTESAVQPELTDFYDKFQGAANSSATEVLETKVKASHEITAPENLSILEVRLPDSSLPDNEEISETTDSDFLFETESSGQSPLEYHEQETPADSPPYQAGQEPVPTLLSSSMEIPKPDPATRLHSAGTTTVISNVHVSPDRKVPVAEQKSPVHSVPMSISAKTPDKKPVAPEVPVPKVVGSGTDISTRVSQPGSGRIGGTTTVNPVTPVKEVALPSRGFFSKIISLIIGIFKRH